MEYRSTDHSGGDDHDPVVEVEIAVDGSSDVPELISTLRTEGSSVQTATLKIHTESFVNRSTEEVSELLAAVGSLPSLKKFTLASQYAAHGCYYELPVQALSAFWREAKHLETFFMRLMILVVNEEHETDDDSDDVNSDSFESLGYNLRNHSALKEFLMENCKLSEDLQESNPHCLDALVRGLSTIYTLEYVNMASTTMSGLGYVSGESLRSLCELESLRRLSIRHFLLSQDHVAQIFPAIANNTKMKELTLGKCSIGTSREDQTMADMLRQNTGLERLIVSLEDEHNKENCILGTAKALEVNSTLIDFTIWGAMTDKSRKAFIKMIRSNYTLEALWMDTADEERTEIMFYTKLNSLGRGHLLRSPHVTKEQWVASLIASRNHLGALFYFLSMNPLLCQMPIQS